LSGLTIQFQPDIPLFFETPHPAVASATDVADMPVCLGPPPRSSVGLAVVVFKKCIDNIQNKEDVIRKKTDKYNEF